MRTVDGVRVYHLEVLPRTPTTLAFTGTIDVAETTHDVIAVDLGVTVAADFGMWKNVRYQQHYEDAGDGHWMPHDITLTAVARLPIKLPKIPRYMSLTQSAHLDHFHVEATRPPAADHEVRIDVARDADQYDNALWLEPSVIPQTVGEQPRLDAPRFERAPAVGQGDRCQTRGLAESDPVGAPGLLPLQPCGRGVCRRGIAVARLGACDTRRQARLCVWRQGLAISRGRCGATVRTAATVDRSGVSRRNDHETEHRAAQQRPNPRGPALRT